MANLITRFLKAASEEVVKSHLGAIEYAGNINPGVFQGPSLDGANYRGGPAASDMWLFGNNGFNYQFQYHSTGDGAKAYQSCGPLAAIINKKAKSYINGITKVVNSKGKEASGDKANRLRKLLKRPNPLQSWKQFEAQQQVYVNIFGWCLLMPIMPAGTEAMGTIYAQSIWNIPPFMVDIEETNKLFFQTEISGIIKKVVLNYNGVKTLLDVQNLFIFRDFTPSFSSVIFPSSRIEPVQQQISNILGAYESRAILINRRGAMGILSNQGKDPLGTIAMEKSEKDDLQRAFSSYGLKKDQWQVIITDAALQWQQMGYATKDLMLFEEIEDDIMRLCDAYDFPYRLLANLRNNSLGGTDADIFLKNLYQDAIIPEAENTYEQWNLFFDTEEYNLNLTKDYSHIPTLQEDKVMAGNARYKMNQALLIEFQSNLITVNQWLSENESDLRPLPEGDYYYSDMIAAGLAIGSGTGGSSTPAPETPDTPPADAPAQTPAS